MYGGGSVHESTGVTPNLIMLGREVRIPSEIVFGSKTRGDQPVVDYGEYRNRTEKLVHHDKLKPYYDCFCRFYCLM